MKTKSKKIVPKNKKTGKKIHFTKRSFMAFAVISLLMFSTIGLVYDNMFSAKAAGAAPVLSNCNWNTSIVFARAQDSSSSRIFVLQFRKNGSWTTVASKGGYVSGSILSANPLTFAAGNLSVGVRAYTITPSGGSISPISSCTVYIGG